MAHLGLICPAAKGHIHPMAALARGLKERGHRVTALMIPDGEEAMRACGVDVHLTAAHAFPPGEMNRCLERLGQLHGRKALDVTLDMFVRSARGILEDAPRAIQETGIEALVIDQAGSSAGTVAEHLGLPFVSVASALPLNRDDSIPPVATAWGHWPGPLGRLRNQIGNHLIDRLAAPVLHEINNARQRWGLPRLGHRDHAYSPRLQITQMVEEFDFPRAQKPSGFAYVGPLVSPSSRPNLDFPWDRLTGAPLLYASMGTLQNRVSETFRIIAEATRDLGFQVLISLGGSGQPADLGELPGDPLVVPYAPQLEILARSALTITHAGLNTALESLSHGVPMVAIPVTNDQPAVAARIHWCGAGRFIPFASLTVSRLRAAVREVSSNPDYRTNAARIGEAMARGGGVPEAARLVEAALFRTRD